VETSRRHTSRSPSPKRKFRLTVRDRSRLIVLLLAIALAAVLIGRFTDFDFREIPRAMAGLNSALVLLLCATLPILGFPISVVYLVLGVRFGPYVGFCIVGAITGLHLLGTHAIANSFLRKPLERWLASRKHRVPEVPKGEGAAIVVVAILVPVLPYFIRNYVLALSGIPLRTYLLVGVPMYTLRSAVTLFLGDLSGDPTRRGLFILGAIYVVKLSICAVIVWWIRERHKKRDLGGGHSEAEESARTLAAPPR